MSVKRQTDNLVGRVIGMLKIISLEDIKKDNRGKNIKYYLCKCECGKDCIKNSRYLTERLDNNCGCVKSKIVTEWGKNRALPKGEAAFNNLYNKYITSASRRGYKFELTKEDFRYLTKDKCKYCGLEPSQSAYSNGYKTSDYIYNGIDRVNNDLGYIKENVVTCCKTCNFAKRNMIEQDFKSWLKRLVINNRHLL